MSIQQMFLGAGGGKVLPEWLDALLIAGGGSNVNNSNSGAGGIVSFTDDSSNTSGTPWNFTDTTYDFGGTWNVYPGTISNDSYMTAALAAGGIQNPAKSVTAIAGGDAPPNDTTGNAGGSGSGGGKGTWSAGAAGGMGTLTGYGGLSQQGNSGGAGWFATEYGYGMYGGGGGFSSQGGTGWAYSYRPDGTAGHGSNNQAPSTNHYVWLGISDDSSYTGQFSQGGNRRSAADGHWMTPKPGDGGMDGLIAIRYSSEVPDPTVTGSPSFYTDTTNSRRIAVWTLPGTFTWG
tara:strand:+ start:7191 stop:8057 length:867 start_codon:yes stop_codon:yes gene_type:complete